MQHHLWYMTLDDHLFLAPIKENPQHVLDIGTGTGIWAIDFGKFSSEWCRDLLIFLSHQVSIGDSNW
jgi:ubiquinone/menaquinone biosynthesis C-methylase UbiE